jgi:hypothetical protein
VTPLLGLSPLQLLPHGLRTGATTHIHGFGGSDTDAKLTGGLRSDAFHIYQRASIDETHLLAVRITFYR